MQEQIKSVENLNKHSESWNIAYNKENFNQMESEYANIQKEINNIMPGDPSLRGIGRITNLHNLIKNNGNNFKISEYERKTAELLA